MKRVLYISFFLSACSQIKEIEEKKVVFKKEACLSQDYIVTECDCTKEVIESNSNIVLLKGFSKSTIGYDSLAHCSKTKLVVYKKEISLDSIYYSLIENKTLMYLPGFTEGKYSENETSIILHLQFINEGLNTSCSTLHEYLVEYDKINNVLKNAKLFFLTDSTAQPCN